MRFRVCICARARQRVGSRRGEKLFSLRGTSRICCPPHLVALPSWPTSLRNASSAVRATQCMQPATIPTDVSALGAWWGGALRQPVRSFHALLESLYSDEIVCPLVEEAVRRYPSLVNAVTPKGTPSAIVACQAQVSRKQTLHFMVENGADLSMRDRSKDTVCLRPPLSPEERVRGGDAVVSGRRSGRKWTCVCDVGRHSLARLVAQLLHALVGSVMDDEGVPTLVQARLRRGASITHVGAGECTPLGRACVADVPRWSTIDCLVRAGSDVDATCGRNQDYLLHKLIRAHGTMNLVSRTRCSCSSADAQSASTSLARWGSRRCTLLGRFAHGRLRRTRCWKPVLISTPRAAVGRCVKHGKWVGRDGGAFAVFAVASHSRMTCLHDADESRMFPAPSLPPFPQPLLLCMRRSIAVLRFALRHARVHAVVCGVGDARQASTCRRWTWASPCRACAQRRIFCCCYGWVEVRVGGSDDVNLGERRSGWCGGRCECRVCGRRFR